MTDKIVPSYSDGSKGLGLCVGFGELKPPPQKTSWTVKNPAGLYLASPLPSGHIVMARALMIIKFHFFFTSVLIKQFWRLQGRERSPLKL